MSRNRNSRTGTAFKKAVVALLLIIVIALFGGMFVDSRSGFQLVLIAVAVVAGMVAGVNLNKVWK